MNNLEFNKTWGDRTFSPLVHFFEHYNRFNRGFSGNFFNFYGSYNNNCLLASAEALEEIDNMNKYVYQNDTIDGLWNNELDPLTIQSVINKVVSSVNKNFVWLLRYLGTDGFFDYNVNHVKSFRDVIRNNVVGKEGIELQALHINFDYFNFTINQEARNFTIRYTQPIKLEERLVLSDYAARGNTDLYIVLPYRDYNADWHQNAYNPILKKEIAQFSYIAFKITDMNGDGDIKVDHIDKIDYLDNFEVTINMPTII